MNQIPNPFKVQASHERVVKDIKSMVHGCGMMEFCFKPRFELLDPI